ncbi:MAG TPA: hypothetical protein VLA12_01350 [Planctomycetaceae bacterium]|nr:hypothetical protein [Planctomycetaceae bacterium]
MKIRIAPISKCLMAGTAGGYMLAQLCGLGFSEADAQQPSTIQQELQKLYESEGREAPDMRLESLPNTTPDGRVFEVDPEAAQLPVPAPVEYTTKQRIMNKLLWWKKSSPPVTPRVRVVPPRNAAQSQQQPNSRAVPAPQLQPAGRPNFQLPQAPTGANAYQTPLPQQQRVYQQPRPLPTDPGLQPAPTYSGQIPVRTASQPRPVPVNTSTQKHPLALPPAPPAEINENQNPSTARPFPAEAKPAADLPDLDALPDEPLPLVPAPQVPDQPKPPADELFPDPFTELSEEAADRDRKLNEIPRLDEKPVAPTAEQPRQPSATPADSAKLPIVTPRNQPQVPQAKPFPESAETEQNSTEAPLEDENPFSGLKLEPAVPVESKPPITNDQPSTQPSPQTDSDTVETETVKPESKSVELEGNPFETSTPSVPAESDENAKPAADGKGSSIPDVSPSIKNEFDLPGTRETSEKPLPEMPKLEKIPIADGEQGNFSWEEEQARQSAKLKLIAARKGETGLKGFCIVSLRDDRDLKDALPQFRSTYNLRTYHFSNLESKIEFDKEPKKYVPAYDGNDPVLLSAESEEREGSLDTALWFKGRLYLFVDKENMRSFENDPVLYAEN